MTTQIELQWQDEPDGDGWYWVHGFERPFFLKRRKHRGRAWIVVTEPSVADGPNLHGRRVAKIPGPPK